jgi:hypothetical protein
MPTIVWTHHRLVPQWVTRATHLAIRGEYAKRKHRAIARQLAALGPEERHRRYEEAKALNIKYGIDPNECRDRHKPFKDKFGLYHRRSRVKVTLPKVSI